MSSDAPDDGIDRTAPEKIWLQTDDDPDGNNFAAADAAGFHMTWCSEDFGGKEVEYRRADLPPEVKDRPDRPGKWVAFDDEGFPLRLTVTDPDKPIQYGQELMNADEFDPPWLWYGALPAEGE